MRRVFVLLTAMSAVAFGAELPTSGPLPEVIDSAIGYPTVKTALEALKVKPGVHIQDEQGWTTIKDRESESVYSIWSFALAGNPAYPSAVKRTLYQQDGQIFIKMYVLCEAAKKPCDAALRDFQVLNDSIKEQLQLGHK